MRFLSNTFVQTVQGDVLVFLEAFEKLGLNTEVTIEDVGVEIAAEGELKSYKGEIFFG